MMKTSDAEMELLKSELLEKVEKMFGSYCASEAFVKQELCRLESLYSGMA